MTTVFDRLPSPPEEFVEAHPHGRINWRVYATELLFVSASPFRDHRAPIGSCTLRSGTGFGEVVLPLYSMAEYEAAEVAHRSGKMLTLSLFIPLAQPKPALDVAKLREKLMSAERESRLANIGLLTDETMRAISMLRPDRYETTISNEALLSLVNEVHELRAYKAALGPDGALELAARLQESEADAARWRERCKYQPKPPMLTAEQLWALQLLREQFDFEWDAAERFARRIKDGKLSADAQGQTLPADVELLDRLTASKRIEQRETSERWGDSS